MTQKLVLEQNAVPVFLLQEPFPVELPLEIQVLVLAHYDKPGSLGHAQTQIQLATIGDFLRKRVANGGEPFLVRELDGGEFKVRYELRGNNGSVVSKILTVSLWGVSRYGVIFGMSTSLWLIVRKFYT